MTVNWGAWRKVLPIGVLLGIMAWALGLGPGFTAALDSGIQARETGHVQLISSQGGFDRPVYLTALIQGITGVESVSARLEVPLQATNAQGDVRQVVVRAFSFVDENKVTAFLSRVIHGVSGRISGLLIPRSWEDGGFAAPSGSVTLHSPNNDSPSVKVPVTGTLVQTISLQGQEFAYLDLGTARSILGAQARVSTLAIRLEPGTDPKAWVEKNAVSISSSGGELKTWDSLSEGFRDALRNLARPLFVFQDLVALAAFLVCLVLGWKNRGVRPTPFRTMAYLLGLLGIAVATALVMRGLFPFWENLLVGGFRDIYPLVLHGPWPWGWSWAVVAFPAGTLGLVYGIALVRFR